MTSLRRRLVLSLSGAIFLAGIAAAGYSYVQVSRQTRQSLDGQLRDVAAVASRVPEGPRNDLTIIVEVWDAGGTMLYSSNPAVLLPRAQSPGYSEAILDGELYRIYAAQFPDRRVAVAQLVDARDDQAEFAALSALVPVMLILPLLAITAAGLVTVLLRPVREAARQVADREPLSSARIAVRSMPREIAPLIDEINRLLERQRQVMDEETAFLVDAAHALRTPLTALQLQMDVLDGSDDPAERSVRAASLRAGIQRAARLSELLLAAAPRRGQAADQREVVALDELLGEVCALYQPIASDAGVTLAAAGEANAVVHCSPRDLVLIFTNLLDNALRYAPSGSTIDVVAKCDGSSVRAEVRDQGPGLAAPFTENAANEGDGGRRSGFGLRAVQSVTARLGGTFRLGNRDDGRSGLSAQIILPLFVP